jgi:hypothetical protein
MGSARTVSKPLSIFIIILVVLKKYCRDAFESLERIPEPKQVDGVEIRMYFEKFLLQPIQFNISFQRTQSVNVEEARSFS